MKMVRLGEVLSSHRDSFRVEDPLTVPLISVRLHGLGAVRRTIGDGKAPQPFTGNRGRAGQFVFSRIWARRGAMALIPDELDGVVVSNEFPIFTIDERKLDSRYLLHYVRTQRMLQDLERASAGASGQNRVKEAAFLALALPLPSLDEQRRITAILDQADALRTKRRQVLAHLDTLTQSIFHDMFGDPSSARELVPLNQVAKLTAGRNLLADDPDLISPLRVVKISAVTTGLFKPSESKPLPPNYSPPASHMIRPGDLLMSRANTAELVGAAAYVHQTPPNLVLSDKVWRFDWIDANSEPLFYFSLFRSKSVRRQISRLSSGTGGSMKNVSMQKLLSLLVPKVSASAQGAFRRRAEHLRTQRFSCERGLAEAEALFNSLQSRAFRGEL